MPLSLSLVYSVRTASPALNLGCLSPQQPRGKFEVGEHGIVFGLDDVLPATPRDRPEEAKSVYGEIMTYHQWDYLADSNPGIRDLLGPLGDADEMTLLRAWEEHLERVLNFPFQARREEQFRHDPVPVGKIVEIQGLVELDDLYGLLAHVRLGRRSYTIPLCDLEALVETSANFQPLNDYVVWFANR